MLWFQGDYKISLYLKGLVYSLRLKDLLKCSYVLDLVGMQSKRVVILLLQALCCFKLTCYGCLPSFSFQTRGNWYEEGHSYLVGTDFSPHGLVDTWKFHKVVYNM